MITLRNIRLRDGMSKTNNPCEFCDEFRGGSQNSFIRRYIAELRDRTVIETRHLKVIPTLGHFVKGYLLIVPKLHFCALADMPLDLIQELEELKATLIKRLSPIYGSYV